MVSSPGTKKSPSEGAGEPHDTDTVLARRRRSSVSSRPASAKWKAAVNSSDTTPTYPSPLRSNRFTAHAPAPLETVDRISAQSPGPGAKQNIEAGAHEPKVESQPGSRKDIAAGSLLQQAIFQASGGRTASTLNENNEPDTEENVQSPVTASPHSPSKLRRLSSLFKSEKSSPSSSGSRLGLTSMASLFKNNVSTQSKFKASVAAARATAKMGVISRIKESTLERRSSLNSNHIHRVASAMRIAANKPEEDEKDDDDSLDDNDIDKSTPGPQPSTPVELLSKQKDLILGGTSLSLLRPRHPLRVKLYDMMYNQTTDKVILFLVLYSTVVLAMKPATLRKSFESSSAEALFYTASELITTILFTVEAACKIIVRGFFGTPRPYISNGWNRLDFLVVVSLWVEFALDLNGLTLFSLSGFRAMRSLLPLRNIRYFEGISHIFQSLQESSDMMSSIIRAMLFFFLLYGVLGIEAFQGTFRRRCLNSDGEELVPRRHCKVFNADLTGSSDKSISDSCPEGFVCHEFGDSGGTFISFDNMAFAFMTLFHVVSLDEWPVQIMHPLKEGEPAWGALLWIYFVSLILLVGFVVLNLFVAVITVTFERVRKESNTSVFGNEQLDTKERSIVKNIAQTVNPSVSTRLARTKYVNQTQSISQKPLPSIATPAARLIRHNANFVNKGSRKQPRMVTPSVRSITEVSVASPGARGSLIGLQAFRNFKGSSRSLINSYEVTRVWKRARFTVLRFVKSQEFEIAIAFLIVANTVSLAMPYEGMSAQFADFLNTLEYVFTSVFIFEMLLKMFAYGAIDYFKLSDNVFDFFVIMITITTIVLVDTGLGVSLPNISILRAFRILRILRVLRRIKKLWQLLSTVLRSVMAVINLLTFMAFCIAAFAILGKELYGSRFPEEERENFDTFPGAMMSLFRVITGDGWAEMMYVSMDISSVDIASSSFDVVLNQVVGAVFFITVFIFTNFIILNLLIAAILENFELSEEERMKEVLNRLAELDDEVKAAKQTKVGAFISSIATFFEEQRQVDRSKLTSADAGDGAEDDKIEEHVEAVPDSRSHLSLGSRWRAWCSDTVESSWFNILIYSVIFMSSLQLAAQPSNSRIEESVFHHPPWNYLDAVFWAVFMLEFVIRCSIGWRLYFLDWWNLMDFSILVSTTVEVALFIFTSRTSGSIGRVFRLVRCLRPLRMLNKAESLKNVVSAVVGSLPSVTYVVILYVAFTMIFAILGLQLFMALFYSCNDDSVSNKSECSGEFVGDGDWLAARAWEKPAANFDSAGDAFLTLFRVTTLEWLGVLYSVSDINGLDQQPQRDASRAASTYLIIFIFLGRFFVLNLFVAVIVEYFKASAGSKLLTKEQKQWVQTRRFIAALDIGKDLRPRTLGRAFLYDVVTSSTFEVFISLCIMLNAVAMSLSHYNQSETVTSIINWVNLVFLIIFTLEMVLKLMAYGTLGYMKDRWNLFDGLVVTGSLLTLAFASRYVFALQLLRAFRVLRLVRLIKRATMLRTMFETLFISMPSMANILLLMLLIFWIYAVIGVSVFGDTREGEGLGRAANFNSFATALLTLFQVATGEGWDVVMDDSGVEWPYCTKSFNDATGRLIVGDCGSSVAPLYFVSFYVIIVFVLMNLFIAVVIENFSYCYEMVEGLLDAHDVEKFMQIWDQFDKDGSGSIHLSQLRPMILNMPKRLSHKAAGMSSRRFYLCVRDELTATVHTRYKLEASSLRTRVKEYFQGLSKAAEIKMLKLKIRLSKKGSGSKSKVQPVDMKTRASSKLFAPQQGAAIQKLKKAVKQVVADKKGETWGPLIKRLTESLREKKMNSFRQSELFMTLVHWSIREDCLTEFEKRARRMLVMEIEASVAVSLMSACFRGYLFRAQKRKRAQKSNANLGLTIRAKNKLMSKIKKGRQLEQGSDSDADHLGEGQSGTRSSDDERRSEKSRSMVEWVQSESIPHRQSVPKSVTVIDSGQTRQRNAHMSSILSNHFRVTRKKYSQFGGVRLGTDEDRARSLKRKASMNRSLTRERTFAALNMASVVRKSSIATSSLLTSEKPVNSQNNGQSPSFSFSSSQSGAGYNRPTYGSSTSKQAIG